MCYHIDGFFGLNCIFENINQESKLASWIVFIQEIINCAIEAIVEIGVQCYDDCFAIPLVLIVAAFHKCFLKLKILSTTKISKLKNHCTYKNS